MVGQVRFEKQKWYPRSHDSIIAFKLSAQVTDKDTTMCPIAYYDEGLGAPASFNANPEHASFGTTNDLGCFPESRVDKIACELFISLTKAAVETDKVVALRVGYMPIMTAFLEDLTAADELSSNTVETTLELQHETTDRQTYPLYNGTKLTEKYATSGTYGAPQQGLTTTQVIEGIDFIPNFYYDALQYETHGGKVQACSGGLKWLTLTKLKPMARIKIHIRTKTKRMNPYTFMGCIISCLYADSAQQIPPKSDLTAVDHVNVNFVTRYNEWNQGFDMDRV